MGRPPHRIVTPERVALDEKRAKWAEEHLVHGVTYAYIAERDGLHYQTVANGVKSYLKRYNTQKAGSVRSLAYARLQALIDAHWSEALKRDKDAAQVVMRCLIEQAKLYGAYQQPDTALIQQVNQVLVTYANPGGEDWRAKEVTDGEEAKAGEEGDTGE